MLEISLCLCKSQCALLLYLGSLRRSTEMIGVLHWLSRCLWDKCLEIKTACGFHSAKPRNLRSVEHSSKSGVCREVGAFEQRSQCGFQGGLFLCCGCCLWKYGNLDYLKNNSVTMPMCLNREFICANIACCVFKCDELKRFSLADFSAWFAMEIKVSVVLFKYIYLSLSDMFWAHGGISRHTWLAGKCLWGCPK